MFYAVFYFSIPLAVAVYYGVFGGSIYQFRKHLRLASGRGVLEATPASRSRNLKIGAGIAIVLLLAFSVSVWQQYRQITRRLASSGNSETSLSYVSDDAHVLDSGTTTSLNDLCVQANEKYKARIALFTVASLNGSSIQSLAQNLLQQQGGGGTGNRTIIIVLAPHNRGWRIQYGNGFGATVTNGNTQAIGNEALPSLRAKNYGAALLTMVRGVIAVLEKESSGNANIVSAQQNSTSDTIKGQVKDGTYDDLMHRATAAAQNGDFENAIALWEKAIPLDPSPAVKCRGEGQRNDIKAAKDTISMLQQGKLQRAEAPKWFSNHEIELWMPNVCNSN
jgi:uncharacterized membrane protein YgcG